MTKQKGLKAIIISLLIILSASCFSLLFTNAYSSFIQTKQDSEALNEDDPPWDTYTLPAWSSSLDKNALATNVENYSAWKINSTDSFITFLRICNPAYGLTTWLNFTNYEGKKIYLTTDITYTIDNTTDTGEQYDGSLIDTFAGTFYGRGNTLTLSGYVNFNESDKGGNEGVFCDTLTGKIHGLRIAAADIYIGSGSSKNTYGGVIAGQNTGTIEECIVASCTYKSNRYPKNCHVAPIAGNNAGTIKNCMAVGTFTFNKNDNADGYNFYRFVASGTDASNCIYQASETDNTKDKLIIHDVGDGNFGSCSAAHTSMTSDIDDVSNYNNYNDVAYYKYNSGCGYGGNSTYCVYIRRFILWTTLTFSASGGTVDTSSVIVPRDYTTATTTSTTVKVYGNTITATASSGYNGGSWSNSGYAYTCTFTKKTYTLKFNNPTGDWGHFTISNSEVTVSYNDVLSVSTSRTLAYDNVMDHWIDYSVNGNIVSTYCIGSSTLNLFDYLNINYGTANDNDITANGVTIGDWDSPIQITPSINRKTYQLTFGSVSNCDMYVDGNKVTTDQVFTVLFDCFVDYTENSWQNHTYTFNDSSGVQHNINYVAHTPLYAFNSGQDWCIIVNHTISPSVFQAHVYLKFAKCQDTNGNIIETTKPNLASYEPNNTDGYYNYDTRESYEGGDISFVTIENNSNDQVFGNGQQTIYTPYYMMYPSKANNDYWLAEFVQDTEDSNKQILRCKQYVSISNYDTDAIYAGISNNYVFDHFNFDFSSDGLTVTITPILEEIYTTITFNAADNAILSYNTQTGEANGNGNIAVNQNSISFKVLRSNAETTNIININYSTNLCYFEFVPYIGDVQGENTTVYYTANEGYSIASILKNNNQYLNVSENENETMYNIVEETIFSLEVQLKRIALTFKAVEFTNITEDKTYYVTYGTQIEHDHNPQITGIKWVVYTIKVNGGETFTHIYQIASSYNSVCSITKANWVSGDSVFEDCTIVPTAIQERIAVKFKDSIGYVTSPSISYCTIDYDKGNYTIEYNFENGQLNYILNNSTPVYYTVPVGYVLVDAGIEKTQTLVTITPQFEKTLALLTFKGNYNTSQTEDLEFYVDLGMVLGIEGYTFTFGDNEVTYEITEAGYYLSGYSISPELSENNAILEDTTIEVNTDIYYYDVTFKPAKFTNITEEQSFSVPYGTYLSVTGYNFTLDSGDEVTYSINNGLNNLCRITGCNTTSQSITSNIDVVVSTEQYKINVQFKDSIGCVVSPSLNTITIDYSELNGYTLEGSILENGLEPQELKYTSGTNTIIYADIQAIYTLKTDAEGNYDYGIALNTDNEVASITVQPEFVVTYAFITFRGNNNTNFMGIQTYKVKLNNFIAVNYSTVECKFTFLDFTNNATGESKNIIYTPNEGFKLTAYTHAFDDGAETPVPTTVSAQTAEHKVEQFIEFSVVAEIKTYFLTFKPVDYTSTGEATLIHEVQHGTTVDYTSTIVSGKIVELTFTFNSESVTYTVTDANLYLINSAEWVSGTEIVNNTEIQPISAQHSIYVQFNITQGDYITNPSIDETKFTQVSHKEYKYTTSIENKDRFSSNMPDNGVNTQTLTYKMDGANVTTYSIPAEYILLDEGINSTNEAIIITPNLSRAYAILTFVPNANTNQTTQIKEKVDINSQVKITYSESSCKFEYSSQLTYNAKAGIKLEGYQINGGETFTNNQNITINSNTTFNVSTGDIQYQVQFNVENNIKLLYNGNESSTTSTFVTYGTELTFNNYTYTIGGNTAQYVLSDPNIYSFVQSSIAVRDGDVIETVLTGTKTVMVTDDLVIDVEITQTAVYVEFNNAKIENNVSSYAPTISNTVTKTTDNKYVIDIDYYNNISGSMPSAGAGNQTLTYSSYYTDEDNTYTLTLATYPNIPAEYVLKDAGIKKSQTTLIITPVLEERYVLVTFKKSDNTTGVNEDVVEKLLRNSSVEAAFNDLSCSFSFVSYTEATAKQKTITYNAAEGYNINKYTINGNISELTKVIINETTEFEVLTKLKTYTVTFKAATHTTQTSDTQVLMQHGEKLYIIVNNKGELKFQFNEYKNTTQTNSLEEFSYSVNTDLYAITSSGWTSGTAITEDTEIQPIAVQHSIYIQFKESKGYITSPSRLGTFTIAYLSGYYTIETEFNDAGITARNLTYVLNGETNVSYSVPAEYSLKNVGIEESDTNIIITPELEEKFALVTFKQSNTNNHTTGLTSNIVEKVLKNSSIGVQLNSLTCEFTYMSYTTNTSGESKTTTYTAAEGYHIVRFEKNGETVVADSVTIDSSSTLEAFAEINTYILTFNIAQFTELTETNINSGEVNTIVVQKTYLVEHGTKLVFNNYEYSFNNTKVTYSLIDLNLYRITNVTVNETIDSIEQNTTITLTTEQYQIYLDFKPVEVNGDTFNPTTDTSTTKLLIPYNGEYEISQEYSPLINAENRTLTYTYNVDESTIYSIPASYELIPEAEHIIKNESSTIITVCPQFKLKYIKLKFQVITGTEIGANGENKVLSVLMDADSVKNEGTQNGLTSSWNSETCEITIRYQFDGFTRTVTYNISGLRTKTYDGIIQNPDNETGTPRSITVSVKLKSYGIIFG